MRRVAQPCVIEDFNLLKTLLSISLRRKHVFENLQKIITLYIYPEFQKILCLRILLNEYMLMNE